MVFANSDVRGRTIGQQKHTPFGIFLLGFFFFLFPQKLAGNVFLCLSGACIFSSLEMCLRVRAFFLITMLGK